MDQISENMDYQQVGADYASVPAKQNINLKPPKRTLSAYACYSRKVYVPPGFPHFLRFNSVRERLGAHRKQCEIFREIADMWRKLPESEKVPFIEEVDMFECVARGQAKVDRERKKTDEQSYNRARRYVEKALESSGAFGLAGARGLRSLQAICGEKDTAQLARFLLEMNRHDLKGTIDLIQETIQVLSTENESVGAHEAFYVDSVREKRRQRGQHRHIRRRHVLVLAEVARSARK